MHSAALERSLLTLTVTLGASVGWAHAAPATKAEAGVLVVTQRPFVRIDALNGNTLAKTSGRATSTIYPSDRMPQNTRSIEVRLLYKQAGSPGRVKFGGATKVEGTKVDRVSVEIPVTSYLEGIGKSKCHTKGAPGRQVEGGFASQKLSVDIIIKVSVHYLYGDGRADYAVETIADIPAKLDIECVYRPKPGRTRPGKTARPDLSSPDRPRSAPTRAR